MSNAGSYVCRLPRKIYINSFRSVGLSSECYIKAKAFFMRFNVLSMNFVSLFINIVLSRFFSVSFYQIVCKESQVFCNSVDVSASQK